MVKGKKKQLTREQIDGITESNSWDKMWAIRGEWGIKNIAEGVPFRGKCGRKKCVRVRKITEKGPNFDVLIREEKIEGVILRLKKKACRDDRIPNECIRYVWEWKSKMRNVHV